MSQRHSHANKIKNKTLPALAYLAFLQAGFFSFLLSTSPPKLSGIWAELITNYNTQTSSKSENLLYHPKYSGSFFLDLFFSAVLGLQQN